MLSKRVLVDSIIDRLYFKPCKWYYRYLGITEENWDRIKNLKSWLKRQNMARLEEIYRRLTNG